MSNIEPLGIVMARLFEHIKVTILARITPNTSNIAPIAPVAGHVIINQAVLEP